MCIANNITKPFPWDVSPRAVPLMEFFLRNRHEGVLHPLLQLSVCEDGVAEGNKYRG